MVNRGNPNWGKPHVYDFDPATPSAFEQIVTKLALVPENYRTSSPLRKWVQQNRHSKYVPEALLAYWGLTVHSSY